MYRFYCVLCCCSIWALLMACEKEFNPPSTFTKSELVVEGYITEGDEALPPYVVLTRTVEYSSDFGFSDLGNLFVKDADVRITDGTDTVRLLELCASDLSQLPEALRQAALQAIGLPDVNYDETDLCVYVDLLTPLGLGLNVQQGGQYDLMIETEEFGITTATTTIPVGVLVDSLAYRNHPSYPENDSLVELVLYFTDPVGPNYYRAFTRRNNEPFYPSSTNGTRGSVTDDRIFEGRAFNFTVVRGQSDNEGFDPDSFGYFWRGDTIAFRGSNIDYEHFRFWQTREYASTSQGPFGSYTRIESNINNGLGVWGGYTWRIYELIVPE